MVGCSRSDEPQSTANTQPISVESGNTSTNAEVDSKITTLTSKVTELAEGEKTVSAQRSRMTAIIF